MKKHPTKTTARPPRHTAPRADMRAEYDFCAGVRGKHAARYAAGSNIVVLKPDIAAAFPNSKAVNDALAGLLKLAAPLRKIAM